MFDVVPAGTTLSKQDDLARFDVPDLQDTADKLVATTEHLLSQEERELTKRRAEDLAKGTLAKKLQEMLKQRANDKDNWVSVPQRLILNRDDVF